MKNSGFLLSIMIATSMTIASLQASPGFIFTPSDDTYVQNNDPGPFGAAGEILVKKQSSGTLNRAAALEFATPGVTPANVTEVSLTLTLSQNIVIASSFNLWGVVNGDGIENFDEATAGYAFFAPPFDSSADGVDNGDSALFDGDPNVSGTQSLATFSVGASAVAGDTVVISSASNPGLLSFLQADNNGISTFLITRDTQNNSYNSYFASKENTTYAAPSLAVTVSGAPPPMKDLRISSFTPVGGDVWELMIEGPSHTAYEFRSDPDLVFEPGALVEDLVQGNEASDPGTVGGLANSQITTESQGYGKVRLTLTGSKNFVRTQAPVEETGYDLWLRYRPLADPAYRATAQDAIGAVVPAGDSDTIAIASGELSRGLGGLLNQTVPVEATKSGPGAVLIGTRANSPVIASQIPAGDLADLGDEGYLIRAVTIESDPCFTMSSGPTESGFTSRPTSPPRFRSGGSRRPIPTTAPSGSGGPTRRMRFMA